MASVCSISVRIAAYFRERPGRIYYECSFLHMSAHEALRSGLSWLPTNSECDPRTRMHADLLRNKKRKLPWVRKGVFLKRGRFERAHCSEAPEILESRVVKGLLGTDPPQPTLESASPSPQGSIWHRFNINQELISVLIRHRFPDLTLFRCQVDPSGGEGKADSKVGFGVGCA